MDLAAELSDLGNVVAFKDTVDSERALQNRRHLFLELAEPGTSFGIAGTSLILNSADASIAWHTGFAAALPGSGSRSAPPLRPGTSSSWIAGAGRSPR